MVNGKPRRFVVPEWDGLTDYEWPVNVGDFVQLTKDDAVVIGTVTQTEGFAPDMIELDDDLRVDIAGWTVQMLPPLDSEPPYDPYRERELLVEAYRALGALWRGALPLHPDWQPEATYAREAIGDYLWPGTEPTPPAKVTEWPCQHPDRPHTVWWWVEDGDPIPVPRSATLDTRADALAFVADAPLTDPPPHLRWVRVFRADNEAYECWRWDNPAPMPEPVVQPPRPVAPRRRSL